MGSGATERGIPRRYFMLQAGAGLAGAVALNSLPGSFAMTTAENRNSIVSLSAVELSRAILSRAVSCREVMSAYLDHIGKLNPVFNALVSLRGSEELLQEANQCDSELSKGLRRGWMHGFPHAIKDIADARGLPTTMGSPIFKNNVANE